MVLRRQHIHGFARAVFKGLQENSQIHCVAGQGQLEAGITAAIEANMAIERTLNADADQLLDQQLKRIGSQGLDELNLDKARQLIKKQLAKQRGFVL